MGTNDCRLLLVKTFGNNYAKLIADNLLPLADDVILLEQGECIDHGPWSHVRDGFPGSVENPKVESQGSIDLAPVLNSNDTPCDAALPSNPEEEMLTIQHEIDVLRQKGSWSVYSYYLSKAGFAPLVLFSFLTFGEVFCSSFMSKSLSVPNLFISILIQFNIALWVQRWVEANEEYPNKNLGLYLGIYGLLFAVSLVCLVGGCW